MVIDREYAGNISARKLVIETAKFNVISVYGGAEAIETLIRFPNIDGIVLDSDVRDFRCGPLIERLREIRADIPIVVVSPNALENCDGERHLVCSYDPKDLLAELRKISPKQSQQIVEHENKLSRA